MASTIASALKPILLSILLVFALGAGITFANPACGTTITSNTVLDSNMACSGTAITIGADNVVLDCAGYSISGTGSGNGIDNSVGYDHITIENCNVTGFSTGLLFNNGANYASIIDNTFSSNYFGLILASDSENGIISGNLVTLNYAGLHLSGTSYDIVANNTVFSNSQYGLYIYGSSNNIITGNNATSNGGYGGIYLIGSPNNNVTNNIASLNTAGVYVQSSSGNSIYNNYLNNSANVVTEPSSVNIWNTTLSCNGPTNIIGRSCVGGNFYATPDGTGISQTCTDANVDGICDSPLNYDCSSTDYLPLAVVGATTIPSTTLDCGSVIKANTVLKSDMACHSTGLSICADNVVLDCAGHSISGVGSSGNGINNGLGYKNVTIKNCNITGFNLGVFFNNGANYAAIINNTVNLNYFGILVGTGSNNSTIADNTVSSNYAGIYLDSGSGSFITSNNVSSSGMYGIVIGGGSGNLITNNTATSNAGYGGIVLSGSPNNNVTNNIASLNTAGITIQSSSGNYIYNNYLNNSANVAADISSVNIWNTTLNCNGPANVIGGKCISGNFYATPDGTGFSQTCTDANADGVCDSSLSYDCSNADSLPLAIAGATKIPPTKLDCGTVLRANTTLTSDMICHSTGLSICADNVVLDCAGHSITGPGSSNNGINNALGYKNVMIKNCNITGFGNGIFFENGANHGTIINNTVNLNYFGILVGTGSNNGTIADNTVSSNYAGIYLDSGSGSFITSNNVSSSGMYGIVIGGGSGNLITNNTATSNAGYGGIVLSGSSNNNVTNNIASLNTAGITIQSSSGNYIYNNYLNNSANVVSDLSSVNNWNTTLDCSAIDTVKSCFGGNFYATPDGTGFSQTCAANSNKVCIFQYDITNDGRNIDYLPIVVWSPLVQNPSPVANLDSDHDGIVNAIDRNETTGVDTSTVYSNDFNDNNGTFGTISSRGGWNITITDLSAPKGVRVSVNGSGTVVKIVSCNNNVETQLSHFGDTADITCGSTTDSAVVASPTVMMRKPPTGVKGNATIVYLNQSNTFTISGSASMYTASGTNTGPVLAQVVDENNNPLLTVSIDPGVTVDVVLPINGGIVMANPSTTQNSLSVTVADGTVLSLPPSSNVTLNINENATTEAITSVDYSSTGTAPATITYDTTTATLSTGASVDVAISGGSAQLNNTGSVPVNATYDGAPVVIAPKSGFTDLCPGSLLDVSSSPYPQDNNHFAWTGGQYFITYNQKTKQYINSSYSLNATHGCTCAQILSFKPGDNNGELKSGCTKGTMDAFVQKKEKWVPASPNCTSPTLDVIDPYPHDNSYAWTGGQYFITYDQKAKKYINSTYTIQQTYGCTCDQILAIKGGSGGELQSGCTVGTMNDFIAKKGWSKNFFKNSTAKAMAATAEQESLLLSMFDSSADAVIVVGLLVALAVGFLFGRKTLPSSKRKGKK